MKKKNLLKAQMMLMHHLGLGFKTRCILNPELSYNFLWYNKKRNNKILFTFDVVVEGKRKVTLCVIICAERELSCMISPYRAIYL